MTISTVGLQAEIVTGSIRKITQDIHSEDLLSKGETEIRYAEWKWLDTHLAVQEMLIQHLRKRIANKCDIDYQATGLVREGKIKDTRPNEAAPQPKAAAKPTAPAASTTVRKPATTTRRYKKSGIDVSINLDIQRSTGNNP